MKKRKKKKSNMKSKMHVSNIGSKLGFRNQDKHAKHA